MILDSLQGAMCFYLCSFPFIIINLLAQKAIYKSKINFTTSILTLGLICSIVFVVGITCYYGVNFQIIDITRVFSKDNFNLDVFSSIKSFFFLSFSGNVRAILNLFGNIGVFIPLGFFLSGAFSQKKRLKIKISLLCFAISVFIELFQASVNRSGDIDDILLNTFGGYLGCLLWYMADNIFDLFARIKKEKITVFQSFLYYFILTINWIAFLFLILHFCRS